MIDIRCIRGIATVTMFIALGFAGLDVALTLTTGAVPSWLRPELRPLPWDLERIGMRISGVVTDMKTGGKKPVRELNVIIGQSTAKVGFDRAYLEKASGPDARWIILFQLGGGIDRLADQADLLPRLDPKPKRVIFALDPTMIARMPVEAQSNVASPARVLEHLRAHSLPGLKDDLQSWVWAFRNRSRVNRDFRRVMYQIRVDTLDAAGQDLSVLFPPAQDPWEGEPLEYEYHQPPGALKSQMSSFWRLGYLDAKSYETQGLPADALVRMIKVCRAQGIPCYLAVMPQSRAYQAKIPAEAREKFVAILRTAFGDEMPPIIDLNGAIPDEFLSDHVHMNKDGRRRASQILLRRLAELPDQP
jgi:hypothetical protein